VATPPDTSVATPPDAPPAPPERHEPTYVTYGRTPEPAVPPPPEPVPPPTPEEPVAQPDPAVEAEAVAGAAPAVDGETLPGLGQYAEPVPGPVPEEPTVEGEPEPEPIEPEPEPPVEPEPRRPEPEPERAHQPGPGRDVIVRRRAVLVGVVGVIAAAALGFALAPKSGGGSTTPTTPTTDALVKTVSNGPIRVTIPAGWQSRAPVTNIRALPLQNQVVVGPSPPAAGTLVIGTADTPDASLLPKALLTALPDGAPQRQAVRLGGAQFDRYLGLQPSGVNGSVSVYALPTTTAGTVLAGCFPSGAAATFPGDCERVLGSLRLNGASAVGLGPSSSLAAGLNAALDKLNTAVISGQGRLRTARKPGQQAAAASQLGAAYTQAAASVRKLDAPPAASGAVAMLAAALAKTGRDYTALSHAAAHNEGRAYAAARNAIGNDTGSVSAAFAQLANLGYTS
jgi:hypothetical protein